MVNKDTLWTKVLLSPALTGVFLLLGCGIEPMLPPPEDIPAALEYIVDNQAKFAEDCEDPLFDAEPGTVVDDLSELDGCWGVALVPAPAITFTGEPVMAFYFLEVFDGETGTHTGWLLAKDAFGLMTVAQGHEGTFAVVEGNRLVTEWHRTSGYEHRSTEDMWDVEWVDDQELTEPREMEYLATLSGDRLRVHFGEADREAVDPGDDCVYVRFDCPEE